MGCPKVPDFGPKTEFERKEYMFDNRKSKKVADKYPSHQYCKNSHAKQHPPKQPITVYGNPLLFTVI